MYIRTKEKGDLPELPELSRHFVSGIRTEKKKTHTRVSLHI